MDTFGNIVERCVSQAGILADMIDETPDLQLMLVPPLNVVCFRFRPQADTHVDLDSLNREILMRVQESGIAVPSSTGVDGRFALRVVQVNHRSRPEDLTVLVETVQDVGRQLMDERFDNGVAP
jgi:glutamate/tyrosine decarboxylase-like PLP-dependent enzyme